MQFGFFDLGNRYDQLRKLKDTLVELNRLIDWNLFADLVAEATTKSRKSTGGASPLIG